MNPQSTTASPAPASGLKSKLLLGLVLVNLALLSAMLPSLLTSSAKAQPRPRASL